MEGLVTGKHRQNCYPERGTRDVTGATSKARSLFSYQGNKAKILPAPPGQGHASFLLLPEPSICFLRALRGKNCTRAANFLPPAQEQPLGSAPRHLLVCTSPFSLLQEQGMCFVILPVRGRAPAWAIATDTFGWSRGTSPWLDWLLLGQLEILPDTQRTHG